MEDRSFLGPIFLPAFQIAVLILLKLHGHHFFLALVEQRDSKLSLLRVIPPAFVTHIQDLFPAKTGISKRVLGGFHQGQVTPAIIDPFEVGLQQREVLVVLIDVRVTDPLRFAVVGSPPDVAFAIVLFVVLPDCLGDFDGHFGDNGLPDARDFSVE